ncbi:hypothetical protein KQI63_16755 [bacterium]|nr:hypothetical protein [bacterium]
MASLKFDGKVLVDLHKVPVGFFDGKTVHDAKGKRLGSVKGKNIKDRVGARAASFDGKKMRSATGDILATASALQREIIGDLDIPLAAMWYFFIHEPLKEKKKESHLNFIG